MFIKRHVSHKRLHNSRFVFQILHFLLKHLLIFQLILLMTKKHSEVTSVKYVYPLPQY